MSALAGDLGKIGGVFAGLAAEVAIFPAWASASRMLTLGWRLNRHVFSNSSGRFAAAQQVNDQDYECDHQE